MRNFWWEWFVLGVHVRVRARFVLVAALPLQVTRTLTVFTSMSEHRQHGSRRRRVLIYSQRSAPS